MRKLLLLSFLLIQACAMPIEKKLPNLTPFALAEYQYSKSLQNELQAIDIQTNTVKLFLRAFKKEQKLEAWVKAENDTKFQLFKTYDFCKSSGNLGPKRKEGDLQTPEGFYHINRFNPLSKFHLSLGLNYPNASDLILSDKDKPGSDIFLHGACVTIGCIPITDEKIRELYLLASFAKQDNHTKIPVHIFPFKMSKKQTEKYGDQNLNKRFWKNLQPIYQYFEDKQSLPAKIEVKTDGSYSI